MPAVVLPARGRILRPLLVLLASLALSAGAVAAGGPAAATGPRSTEIHAWSPVVNYDHAADLRIHVVDASGDPIGGLTVRVYRQTFTGYTRVATLTTGTTSKVAHYRPALRHTTAYKVVFAGTSTWAARTVYRHVTVRSLGASLVRLGSTKKGSPYQYGAAGPSRFDCSGFTRWVAAHFGKDLPHSSSSQYGVVRHVAKSDKRVGDLVFLHDSSGHVYHVGFYAGNGALLAATHTGDYVRTESLWTSSYYVGRLNP